MATIQKLRTMLATNDLDETIEFYEKVLGFSLIAKMGGEDGGKPFWAQVARDDVALMFTWDAPHEHGPGEEHSHDPALSGSLYITVDDADGYFAEVNAKASSVHWEPETQPYGMRDFGITDPNGYMLIFGSPVEEA